MAKTSIRSNVAGDGQGALSIYILFVEYDFDCKLVEIGDIVQYN
jgi:hypothetical protein